MNIQYNGKILELSEGLSVEQFIRQKGLHPETVIVEYNFQLVTREAWTSIVLKENDSLEILRFVGGG